MNTDMNREFEHKTPNLKKEKKTAIETDNVIPTNTCENIQ